MSPISTAISAIHEQANALDAMVLQIEQNTVSYRGILDVLRAPGLSNYASRIIITGVGKNAHIAAKASETFASLGLPSLYLNTGHYTHGDAGFIGPKDVVVHISRSGKTEEMINLARHLRGIRPNVKQVLLHCNPDIPADCSVLFDWLLCTGKAVEVDENALAPTTSTVLLLALIDTFAINLSSERKFTSEDFLAFHPGGSLGKQLRGENESLSSLLV